MAGGMCDHEAPQVYGGRENDRRVAGSRKRRRAKFRNTVMYAQKKKQPQIKGKGRKAMEPTHLSVPAFFIIVSLPDEAAFTICCSTDLFILALSACIMI